MFRKVFKGVALRVFKGIKRFFLAFVKKIFTMWKIVMLFVLLHDIVWAI